ncbi:MAG: YgdI/YgdR family lipoprotein [Verrucomicrobiota bacterium]|nr:YgdI/YgdR family lipoprotein [Verrucomicrobiota bacterium]
MKFYFCLFFIALLFCGCRSRYDIALNNGTTITGIHKPVLDQKTGQYHYKDAHGQEHSVSAMRVKTIAPQGESDETTNKKFKPPSTPSSTK